MSQAERKEICLGVYCIASKEMDDNQTNCQFVIDLLSDHQISAKDNQFSRVLQSLLLLRGYNVYTVGEIHKIVKIPKLLGGLNLG